MIKEIQCQECATVVEVVGELHNGRVIFEVICPCCDNNIVEENND